jgi:hypothetical protein
MPPNLQEGMHDAEVVEWLQTDTNLVGCIERKARVVKAASYDEVRWPRGRGSLHWAGARARPQRPSSVGRGVEGRAEAAAAAAAWLGRTHANPRAAPKPPTPSQALSKLTAEEAAGEWHFCRGALDVETGVFMTYEEIEKSG